MQNGASCERNNSIMYVWATRNGMNVVCGTVFLTLVWHLGSSAGINFEMMI